MDRHSADTVFSGPIAQLYAARDPARLGEATDVAAEAIGRRFGRGPVDGKIQAHVISIAR
jgi:hypothetical protein